MSILEEIARWKLEAADEDSERYFFHLDEIKELESGEKCYVIGRKGTGKSAICSYFETMHDYNKFCQKLSFKEFPFKILYSLKDKDYTSPSQYISLWKYFIYNSILKNMARNNDIDSVARQKLLELYPEDSVDYMNRTMQHWTKKSLGAGLIGFSGSASKDRKVNEISEIWQDLIPCMEDIIRQYAKNEYYYIVIDELDEDYRNYWDTQFRDQYLALITSLFKAVSNIRKVMSLYDKNVFPIVFLRDDIYSLLSDPDSNKWEDQKVYLKWTKGNLKEMLAFRMSRSKDPSGEIMPYQEISKEIFGNESIQYGKNKKVSNFDFISELSHQRPRDFVRFFRDCARAAIKSGSSKIGTAIVKGAEKEFSNHLKSEIVNEVSGVIRDISQIFDLIGQKNKQRFRSQEFQRILQTYTASKECHSATKRMGHTTLSRILFHFSIIGNATPAFGNRPRYKFEHESLTFSSSEAVVVHRGLLRALGAIQQDPKSLRDIVG